MVDEQLGKLNEDENYLVLRHRRQRAYQKRPMTLFGKIMLGAIGLLGVMILAFNVAILVQVKDYKANGEKGDVPAPMSWIYKPKQVDGNGSKQSPVIVTCAEA